MCSGKADILFLVDSSGSVRTCSPCNEDNDDWLRVLNFVNKVISHFNVSQNDTRVGMIQFSTYSENRFYLNTYDSNEDVYARVLNSVFNGGMTNTADALLQANVFQYTEGQGDRSDVLNIVVLITDGKPNIAAALATQFATDIKNKGGIILVIGVGEFAPENMILEYSSQPKQENISYWRPNGFRALENVELVKNVADRIYDYATCGGEKLLLVMHIISPCMAVVRSLGCCCTTYAS